jgi:glycosyltransferase involved in cell wall biosynthesis
LGKYILYIGEMEFPDKNAAAQRVLANCKIIEESTKREIVIVGLNSSIKETPDYNIAETVYSIEGFKVYEYPYPKTSKQWLKYITQIDYVKYIVNILGVDQVDAIVAYNYPAIALERLRLFCKKNNMKIISDTTEWYGKSQRNFPGNIVKDLDTFLRMRVINKKCKNVICASEYLENYYTKHNCNVLNIPSLVNDFSSKFPQEPIYNKKNFKLYCYVGSPGRSKEKDRLDWIVTSFYKLKDLQYDFKLIFAGVDQKSFLEIYPELKEIVNQLKDRIEFKGRVPHQEALNIIATSDFSLFARVENRVTSAGFPTKLAESYGCNTPIITTPSSNVKNYIINGKTGFVSTTCHEESFYNAILESAKLDNESIKDMKSLIKDKNPMSLPNYYDKFFEYFRSI